MQKFYFRKPVSVYSQRFSPFSDFAFAIFELFSFRRRFAAEFIIKLMAARRQISAKTDEAS
jgi:hypothetical protein